MTSFNKVWYGKEGEEEGLQSEDGWRTSSQPGGRDNGKISIWGQSAKYLTHTTKNCYVTETEKVWEMVTV